MKKGKNKDNVKRIEKLKIKDKSQKINIRIMMK